MVIKIDYQNKENSIYECDKCKRTLSRDDIYKIKFSGETLHLCKRCFIILERWFKSEK